jgi:protein phosphatase
MSWWNARRPRTPRHAVPPSIRAGGSTHIGLVRGENQDHFGIFERASHERLYIVADGMGGHDDGAEAAHLAVDRCAEVFHAHEHLPVQERLRKALLAANATVYAASRSAGIARRMGTTLTVLALVRGHAYAGHVGDSRLYVVRKGETTQLTVDHTVAEALRRDGLLSTGQARRHAYRHALTRAVGVHPEVAVDVLDLGTVRAPIRYVLCSDGLDRVHPPEIESVTADAPPQEAAERLIALANERGGSDNITAVVVSVS